MHRPTHNADIVHWLARCLEGQAPQAMPGDDFQEILDQASYHGVTPLLSESLKQQPGEMPEALTRLLQRASHRHAAVELARSVELTAILQLLQQHQLDFILLKGEALAHTLYPQPYQRPRTDTDLLFVDKPSAHKAAELLQARGYSKQNVLEGEFVGFQFTCSKKLSPQLSIHFDLHSAINDYLWFARCLPYEELKANVQTAAIEGTQVTILNPVYSLLHACIHFATNRPIQIEARLIWLYDVKLLAEAMAAEDWQHFLKLCQGKQLSALAADMLGTSLHHFNSQASEHIATLQQQAKEERGFAPEEQARWKMYWEDFKNNKGAGNKLRQLKEHLFPSKAYMLQKYQPKHPLYLPYYYLLRLLSGFSKHLPKRGQV